MQTNCLFSGPTKSDPVIDTTNLHVWTTDLDSLLDSIGIYFSNQSPEFWTVDLQMKVGKVIYDNVCWHCHGRSGRGEKELYPPLAKSDYLMADRDRSIYVVLNGLTGEIVVNGEVYDGEMPKIYGSNGNIASILTYVRNFFNQATDSISLDEVARVRDSVPIN